MQIQLHADPHTDGSSPVADHLQTVVRHALGRFGERVTRVDAHLSGVDGPSKPDDGNVHCTLEAALAGAPSVVVKDHATNAHQAIDGALRKLKRAIGAGLAVHDPRGRRGEPAVAAVPVGDAPV